MSKVPFDQESCINCYRGWMRYSEEEGVIVYYDLAGGNMKSCPCTCSFGEKAAQRIYNSKEFLDWNKLKSLQAAVESARRLADRPADRGSAWRAGLVRGSDPNG